MSFPYDATGIKMDQSFSAAPAGVYGLVIVAASDRKKTGEMCITRNGDPYVSVECEIDDAGEWLGKKVWHNVTFLPKERKGAGMALDFLKAIGEPWEGAFDVAPQNWVGKRFRAKLNVTTDNRGRPRNEISYLVSEDQPKDNEVPF